MKLFDRFKKMIACAILTAFIPSQAWAQGITIPAGSALNINTGTLTVPGNVTNAGTLAASSGTINLNGNWTNSGTFNAGTSTVNFNATSGTQNLNSGGTAAGDAFYNLTHTTNGTVSMAGNDILINNNFTNTTVSGAFNTNNFNMTVDGNWDNTSASTFTPGTDTVTLNGANGGTQDVLGTTTFYNFSKINSAAASLIFDTSGTQIFTHDLTMEGNSGTQLLTINSTTGNTQANINLRPGGAQSIQFVNVNNSNASGGGTGLQLLGRNSPDHSNFATYDNTNWAFGNATITWIGVTSTEWQNVTNWDKGVVPGAGDTVIIPPVGGSVTFDPDLCPSGHINPCSSVNLGNGSLTIQSGATLTLSGQGLAIATGTFANSGTVFLHGNETVTLTQDTTNHGTFNYQGTDTGSTDTLLSSYYNLVINDANATKDAFVTSGTVTTSGDMTVTSVGTLTTNGALTADGNLTLTSGTLDISTHTNTLTVGGTLSLNGASAVLTATNGNIAANGAVSLTAGTFTAPGAGKTFTVTGNFTNNAGNYVAMSHPTGFNNSSGIGHFKWRRSICLRYHGILSI